VTDAETVEFLGGVVDDAVFVGAFLKHESQSYALGGMK
jgi:hypothetical protein